MANAKRRKLSHRCHKCGVRLTLDNRSSDRGRHKCVHCTVPPGRTRSAIIAACEPWTQEMIFIYEQSDGSD